VGKVGLVLAVYVVQVVSMAAIGVLLFDVLLPTDAASWSTFGWVSALGLVTCTLLGVAFSSVARNGRGAPALVTPIVLVLQFTSGVFFQYDELPPWMQQFAALFPLKWLAQGMRSVFLPDTFQQREVAGSWELGRTALVMTLWAAIALVLALRGFRWQRRGES
jgi:ABC-2 type transport system permease protein